MRLLRSLVGAAFLTGLLTLAGCGGGSENSASNTPTGTAPLIVTISGTHVSMSPAAVGALYVNSGKTLTIAVTADTGYTRSSVVGGTCPAGSWNGNSYVTGAITANCSVAFGTTQNVYGVTPSADVGVTATPSTAQSVNYGAAQAFTLTISTGYDMTVGGTCPAGALAGNVYTTGAVTADCTVTFNSALKQLTVTPTGDGHVNISPSTPHKVNYAVTDSFTVTAASGYTLSHTAGGNCPAGTFFGNTYIMGLVTADCTVSFSSFPSWSGIKQQGAASARTEGGATTTDRLGNVYVTGYTEGALNGNTMMGARDAFLAKYDPSGHLTWLKNLGAATHYTTGSGIWVDSNANVFIVGYTDGGLNGNTDPTGQDFFFAKYASDGTLVWVKQAGAPSQTSAAGSITTDSTGDIYVAGSTTGGLYGASQSGFYDYFVSRYDASGNLVWIQQLGSGGAQTFGASVRVDSSGNVFVSGAARAGLAGNTQHGDFDYLIAKHDSAGNLLWLKQNGVTSKITTGLGMELDSAGNPILSGGTTAGLNGNSQHGNDDYYIAKYDTNGNLDWLSQVGGAPSTSTGALALTVDSADNVLVTGYTNASLAGNTLAGQQDAFVAKHDSSGNLTWVKQLGTPTPVLSAGLGVAVDWADNIFATGYAEGDLPGNTVAGTADYFVAKYDSSGVRQ